MSNELIKQSKNKEIATSTHWLNDFFAIPKENLNERSMAILEKEVSVCFSDTLKYKKIQTYLNQGVSQKNLLVIIRTAILNTAQGFKYSEKMTPMQAYVLACDLLEKMKYESLEDILLMLRMGRRGELGGNKGRFDSDVLFTLFLPAYFEKKAAIYEKNNELLYDQSEDNELTTDQKKKQQKLINQLHERWKAQRKPKHQKVFEPVDHHSNFLENLKKDVDKMTKKSILNEMNRAKNHKMMDAYEIYENELKTRK